MKLLPLIAFVALAIIQWLVPGSIILKREKILKEGKIFMFLTEPVDPSEPFLGKYIHLNFKENEFAKPGKRTAAQSANFKEVYVLLEEDKDGFAKIKNLQWTKPAGQADYVKALAYVRSIGNDSIGFHLNYSFENFYMDEFKAPKAEEATRRHGRGPGQRTFAVVSVLHGDAVIRDVMVDDMPIREYIKKIQ
jgi:uncharacterized membrane-anchored protein